MNFKEILIELINEKTNGSQKELAEQTGIPASTINCWLKKDTKPTYVQILKLADFFEVSVDYLLGRESDSGIVNINANLSDSEKNLVYMFRKLDAKDKCKVQGFVQALYEK